jgi:HSP20 family protein
MKEKSYIDIGRIMDEFFDAAIKFGDSFREEFQDKMKNQEHPFGWDEKVDYYPAYSYPPANIFFTPEKDLQFEFALAGFNEKCIDLQFSGDYMLFSATVPEELKEQEKGGVKYFKRRLKLKDIHEQKYYVPEDKFDRDKVTAKFKDGILKVVVPAKEEIRREDGIKVEIVREEDE